ncbi:MAG: hypothetical protein RIN56_01380 [Sporomusaceae bacterium]|nr:hypothetical protein [Sporomusaceae bacterium]
MDHFWTYTLWYILLGLTTVGELAAAFLLARNRRLAFGLYFILAGVVLSFETMILIFGKAYTYYPMLLQTSPDPFDRVLAGNLFSQFSVAATALLVAILGLDFRWSLLLAAAYGLVEELFLALGIYSHNWYRTWMTVIGLFLYFQLAKNLNAALLLRGISSAVLYGCIFIGLFPLYIVTIVWALMVSGHLSFSAAILPDPVDSRYLLVLAVYTVPGAAAALYMYYARPGLLRKALAAAALFLLYFVGAAHGLIIIPDGLFLPVTAATTIWAYLSVAFMDWLLRQTRTPPYRRR